jgi:hypothetical protein
MVTVDADVGVEVAAQIEAAIAAMQVRLLLRLNLTNRRLKSPWSLAGRRSRLLLT